MALLLIGCYMFHMQTAGECVLFNTHRIDEESRWDWRIKWQWGVRWLGQWRRRSGHTGTIPREENHVSAVTRVLPLPLLRRLDLPRAGLSHPLHQGWMPHTTLHNSAIYWQRQNAFLCGSKVWLLYCRHRDDGNVCGILCIRIDSLATGSSISVLRMTCTIQSCLK